jgi:phosphoglycerate dehydrogenase-like enzyme
MDVIGWDKFLNAQQGTALGVRWGGSDRAELLKMVASCNAVTVHVALVPETKQMCNAEFLRRHAAGIDLHQYQPRRHRG